MYCLNLSLPPPFFFPHSILPFTLPPPSLALSLSFSLVFLRVFFVCTACHYLMSTDVHVYIYTVCAYTYNILCSLPFWLTVHSCPSILSIFWCGLEYVHNSVLHTARACNYGKHYQCSVIRFPRTWSVRCTYNCTLLHTHTHPPTPSLHSHSITHSLTHFLPPPPPPPQQLSLFHLCMVV